MTDQNYTHITLVSDRSGSMAEIRDDAQGGIRSFVKEQKELPGTCTFAGYEFDTAIDVWSEFGPISEVPDYILKPRGTTALLDAIGLAVTQTGEKLAALPEAERPGKVIVLVSTDGRENNSNEWNAKSIKDLITKQTDEFSWQFIFMGATKDAVTTAVNYGFSRGQTVSNAPDQTGNTYAAASSNIASFRASGQSASLKFTDEQRKQADGK